MKNENVFGYVNELSKHEITHSNYPTQNCPFGKRAALLE